jgi:hypothetical protein
MTVLMIIGNIALVLETTEPTDALFPKKRSVWTQPTFEDNDKAGLIGRVFYELHPQLWGQGLMSEVLAEVLRFAMEEVGCTRVTVSPRLLSPDEYRRIQLRIIPHQSSYANDKE